MPMRAIRASKAYAGAHVKANLRLWTGILVALSAAFLLLLHTDALGLSGDNADIAVQYEEVRCDLLYELIKALPQHAGFSSSISAPARVGGCVSPPCSSSAR